MRSSPRTTTDQPALEKIIMADHIAAARTNYFRVKDLEDALIERAEQTFGIKPATLAHY